MFLYKNRAVIILILLFISLRADCKTDLDSQSFWSTILNSVNLRKRSQESVKKYKNVTVKGIVRQIGNAPNINLVITGYCEEINEGDRKADFYIKPGDEVLQNYIYKHVEVKGTVEVRFIKYAKSDKGFYRYYLHSYVIMNMP